MANIIYELNSLIALGIKEFRVLFVLAGKALSLLFDGKKRKCLASG